MDNREHNALVGRLQEAQRVVDLAEQEGIFDDCYAKEMNKRGRKETKKRIHVRMGELLAGQYPDLRWVLVDAANTRTAILRGRPVWWLWEASLQAGQRYHTEMWPRRTVVLR